MRFLIDAQLPPALAGLLREAGHRAEHVFELGEVSVSDREIWNRARETGAVIVTKDRDFLLLSRSQDAGTPVVLIRFGNTRKKVLFERFMRALPELLHAFENGERVLEIV